MMQEYNLPKVWQWKDENDNRSGNRPTAGARFEQNLPRGEKPFQVYSLGTPNGIKVTVMFEELLAAGVTEAAYDLFLINIGKGDQFGSDFVDINPNSKIPAMVDQNGSADVNVFESGSILLYLADKFGQFIPKDVSLRTECLNWVFWQVGSAPFVGGGFGHFFNYAPTKQEYPINRYTMETKRLLDVLDQHLEGKTFIVGEEYTIADIINWSWFGRLALDKLYDGSFEFLDMKSYPNVVAWAERINQRPAVQKALNVEYKQIKA